MYAGYEWRIIGGVAVIIVLLLLVVIAVGVWRR